MNVNYKDDMEIKIMEAFASVKSDQEIGMPDVEEELSKIMVNRNKQDRKHWRNIAAAVAVIVTASCIAVAAIINNRASSLDEFKLDTAMSPLSTQPGEEQVISADTTVSMPHMVTFENAELNEIMDSIDNIYNVEVVFMNDDVRHLHLHFKFDANAKLSNVVQNLNMFDKINIKEKEGKLEVE